MDCAVDGCEREAVVELHVPRAENRFVCTAHARVQAREEGVVADPIDDGDGTWR